MGTSDAKHPYEDEKPAHTVSLPPFYLQETEVTFGQMEWFFETHRDVERPEDYVGATGRPQGEMPFDRRGPGTPRRVHLAGSGRAGRRGDGRPTPDRSRV